jgi:hypothetical protein
MIDPIGAAPFAGDPQCAGASLSIISDWKCDDKSFALNLCDTRDRQGGRCQRGNVYKSPTGAGCN